MFYKAQLLLEKYEKIYEHIKMIKINWILIVSICQIEIKRDEPDEAINYMRSYVL